MKTKIFTDEEILNEQFRAQIIEEINGAENTNRKKAQAAALRILRDGVKPFVMERMSAQGFRPETLAIMEQRASNINLFKKIVSKKARSYSKGVDRSVPDNEQASGDIDKVAGAMGLTRAMKKADKYRKAIRNTLLYIYPELVENPDKRGELVWGLCTKVFWPHLYDVIPDARDHEKMRCLILSPFATSNASFLSQLSIGNGDGRALQQYSNPIFRADGIEQSIANSPQDTGSQKREYVWWTSKYHLTTNEKGQILAGKTPTEIQEIGPKNPIQRLPTVNLAEEQDGEFWATGGEDVVDATILLNLKITDMESILHFQGWGQLAITGENLKKKDFKVGPQNALMLETDTGATHKTEAALLAHDPHTDEHLKSAEAHVALVLTTNNLSIKSVATNLEAGTVASGIAKMVDESENMEDISDDQGYYAEKEKEAMVVAEAWCTTLREVPNCLKAIKESKPLLVNEMVTQFHNQDLVMSEQERLQNLQLRKDLGLDTIVDLIKRDNPQMTEKQAMAKALQIQNANAAKQADDRATELKNKQAQGENPEPEAAEEDED